MLSSSQLAACMAYRFRIFLHRCRDAHGIETNDFQEAISTTTPNEVRGVAKKAAAATRLPWDVGIQTILDAAINNPVQSPALKGFSVEDVIAKWVGKYRDGLLGRISQRRSKLCRHNTDPIIDLIVGTTLPHLTEENIEKIRYGHRLAMSAENVLGLLLEEYLATELAKFSVGTAHGGRPRHYRFCECPALTAGEEPQQFRELL